MAGLPLLLGLLACAPLLYASQPVTVVLTEMCYHPVNVEYVERQLENASLKMMPTEGKKMRVAGCNVNASVQSRAKTNQVFFCAPVYSGISFKLIFELLDAKSNGVIICRSISVSRKHVGDRAGGGGNVAWKIESESEVKGKQSCKL